MKNLYLLSYLALLALPLVSNSAYIEDFSPVSHWTCDETTGVRYDSVASSSHDLTSNNSVGYTTGKLNNACYFDGTNWLSVSDHADFEGGDHTFTAWVNLDASRSTNAPITSKWGVYPNTAHVWEIRTNGQIYEQYLDSSLKQDRTRSNQTISDGTWTFVAVTVDVSNDTITHYYNGSSQTVTVESDSNPTDYRNTTADFRIGYRDDGASYFEGAIDEITFFDAVMSSTTIQTMYNSGTPLEFSQPEVTNVEQIIVPYEKDMPKITTIVTEGATSTINYATTTDYYIVSVYLQALLVGLLFTIAGAYIAYKFV